MQILITALLIMAPNWKQAKYPSIDESINQQPYNGILLSNGKEETANTHNVDES